MAQKIKVGGAEPAHEWIGALAHETGEEELYPDDYEWGEVRRLVLEFAESFKRSGEGELAERFQTLRDETALSEREAEVVAMKELGMTHDAIAFFYAILDEGTTGDDGYPTAPSTIDEYSRRARSKYESAKRTADELSKTYGG